MEIRRGRRTDWRRTPTVALKHFTVRNREEWNCLWRRNNINNSNNKNNKQTEQTRGIYDKMDFFFYSHCHQRRAVRCRGVEETLVNTNRCRFLNIIFSCYLQTGFGRCRVAVGLKRRLAWTKFSTHFFMIYTTSIYRAVAHV